MSELFLADTILVISEGVKDPSRLEVIVNVDEVKTLALNNDNNSEIELRHENALDYSWLISIEEGARGIQAKILDPYGYIWALSQTKAKNTCKQCYCSSPIHLFDSLCTHPRTLRWIKLDSHTSAYVQELNVSTKLEEVYCYMVVIRWANLIIRFKTKEIEKRVLDAYERKLGVESVVKLLQTILAKVGYKEGMNDSINTELVHWIDLLG
ncbi:hypothetical protein F2Q70_00016331 [Brassica cretica]|uniref:Uncharacterized protein n=1 Tax=Brassica cretica TaxID=69181 RepID=A0A8S9HM19_BRACR|nr:hypothetical protein F2Q70_00016331 [Brassica cretica]KAF2601064.1 hypothetical protein F2Q68_00009301 [Brassica cretica]